MAGPFPTDVWPRTPRLANYSPSPFTFVKLDRDTVKAGRITFRVINESEALVYESIVLQTDLDVSQLPYDPRKGKATETQLKSLGELEEL
jgi:hypothetical protein